MKNKVLCTAVLAATVTLLTPVGASASDITTVPRREEVRHCWFDRLGFLWCREVSDKVLL